MTRRERPILFSAPMVRAILAGTKSVTRRVVNPQPRAWDVNPAFLLWRTDEPVTIAHLEQASRYGVPGDRLWVRETFDVPPGNEKQSECAYRADYDSNPPEARWRPSIHMPRWASRITLEVTSVRVERLHDITEEDAKLEGAEPWPSDPFDALPYSPKVAPFFEVDFSSANHRSGFRWLWESINGKRPGCSWSDNPWVWRIAFKRADEKASAS